MNDDRPGVSWAKLPGALIGTTALILAPALLWAYWPTLESLTERWGSNPQYSHGFVVPFFALIVLWYRRGLVPARPWQPAWWGLGLVILGAILRLSGAYYYLAGLDGLSLIPSLAGICVLLGGLPLLRWAWPGVAFLLFMVPPPYQLETGLAHPLQGLVTTASTYALQTLGFPAVAQGNVILIDDLKLGVQEACSGLGMLVTFFALSTAVVFLVQRPRRDKVIIFLSAIPIGVLANLIRVTATGVLHCTLGREWGDAFHDGAGWLMMPLALILLWLELTFLKHLWVFVGTAGPVSLFLTPLSASAATSAAAGAPPVPDAGLPAKSEPSLLEISK
jgi:exosortase